LKKVYERIQDGLIELQYIPTQQMLADGLTKALKGPQHNLLFNNIMEGKWNINEVFQRFRGGVLKNGNLGWHVKKE
jgi:hypothetical protein